MSPGSNEETKGQTHTQSSFQQTEVSVFCSKLDPDVRAPDSHVGNLRAVGESGVRSFFGHTTLGGGGEAQPGFRFQAQVLCLFVGLFFCFLPKGFGHPVVILSHINLGSPAVGIECRCPSKWDTPRIHQPKASTSGSRLDTCQPGRTV